jgi:hypothetical protein
MTNVAASGMIFLLLPARGNFQAGQTAKARLGLPCAVTPERGVAAGDLTLQKLRMACSARILPSVKDCKGRG